MQPMKPEERREFQRLELRPPIPGTLGAIPVSILEIGVLGARVQHAANLDDKYIDLRFSYGGNEVEYGKTVRHAKMKFGPSLLQFLVRRLGGLMRCE